MVMRERVEVRKGVRISRRVMVDSVGFPTERSSGFLFFRWERDFNTLFTWLVVFGGEHERTEKVNRMGLICFCRFFLSLFCSNGSWFFLRVCWTLLLVLESLGPTPWEATELGWFFFEKTTATLGGCSCGKFWNVWIHIYKKAVLSLSICFLYGCFQK